MKRAGWVFAPAGLVLTVGLAAGSLGNLRLNVTGSLPLGVYQVVEGQVRRGDLVLACPEASEIQLEARARGYVRYGVFCPGWFGWIIKYAAALPGDVVTATAEGIAVNGQPLPNTSRVDADSKGRPLPPLPASGQVPDGWVWLLSTHAGRSFDSRYWGPVPLSTLRGRVRPVWLFKRTLRAFPRMEGQDMEQAGSQDNAGLQSPKTDQPAAREDDETAARKVLEAKLQAFDTPGMVVEFDPDEAEQLGAFQEDAMSVEDAMEASTDEDEVT